MRAREKASELVDSMWKLPDINDNGDVISMCFEHAKQCALIAVDEILNARVWIPEKGIEYWQQVKTEIENL